MNSARITASVPCRKMTDKAIRVTVDYVDGESMRASTCWLPRSICTDLVFTEVDNGDNDGTSYLEISATVPMWWIRKLDTRAAWEHAGHTAPPMAQRPF